MEVFKEIIPLRAHLKSHKTEGRSIGLVPTMGALHEGHLALIRSSVKENDITVCSIYVNPTQFNNQSDLKSYPRALKTDLELLQNEGCEVVFAPTDEEMYPEKVLTNISFGKLEKIMEGTFRPGHFNGVATVVSKLFNIVEPDLAYFGQKDLQQFVIIKQLVNDLHYPVKLRCIDIVREPDGLAKSSRNLRLSTEERKKSVALHQAMLQAKKLLMEGASIDTCIKEATNVLNLPGVKLEYFEIVDVNTLGKVANISAQNSVAVCVAAYVGEVRLIDNMIISLN